jgi:flagellar basal-body rod modification protein FlgD
MSTVNTVTSPSNAADPQTAGRVPQKELGQNDFLKLLTVQLAKQDPMKPMEDTAFIAQMAQFSTLQQTSAMATNIASLKLSGDFSSASALLGRAVTFTDKSSPTGTTTGTVTGIDASGSSPTLMVGDKTYSLGAVVRVEPAALPAA